MYAASTITALCMFLLAFAAWTSNLRGNAWDRPGGSRLLAVLPAAAFLAIGL
jgi:hypothetical protein